MNVSMATAAFWEIYEYLPICAFDNSSRTGWPLIPNSYFIMCVCTLTGRIFFFIQKNKTPAQIVSVVHPDVSFLHQEK